LPPRRHPPVRAQRAACLMSPAPRKAPRKARVKAPAAGRRTRGSAGVPAVLLDLLSARGPSGRETAPAAVWREAAAPFAEVSTDLIGTPLALVAPRGAARGRGRG